MKKFLNIVAIFVLSFVIFNLTISKTDGGHLLSIILALIMFAVLMFNNKRKKYGK